MVGTLQPDHTVHLLHDIMRYIIIQLLFNAVYGSKATCIRIHVFSWHL